MVEESLQYIKNFIRDPRVASVSPTSKHATKVLTDGIDFTNSRIIVEYGPGNGVITRELLSRMRSDAVLITVEINEDFYKDISRINDSRLISVLGSAEDIESILKKHGFDKADTIISGIPFSLLRMPLRKSILAATRNMLRDDGVFHVYQASKQLRPLLRGYFGKINTTFVWRNVPPLFIFRCSDQLPPEGAAPEPAINAILPIF